MADSRPRQERASPERKRAWTAFRATLTAALHTSTQRAFSSQTGISTATLQRIIKAGEEPWFNPERASPTARKEWARIVTAIATGVGVGDEQRREWMRSFGLPYDPTTDERTRRDLARRSVYDGDETIAAVRASGRLRIGVMVFPPFSHSEQDQRSFLHNYARPLLMAIFPRANLAITNHDDPETAIELMNRSAPELDIAVGLLDTIPRRMRGLDFIPIPGLVSPLGARWIGHGEGELPDLETPDAPFQKTKIAVISGEAGHLFLKGALNYRPLIEISDPVILPKLEELAENNKEGLLFIADETICGTLDKTASSLRRSPVELPGLSSVRYRVSIAVRATASRLRDLVEQSIEQTMRGALVKYTNRLYEQLILDARLLKMDQAAAAIEHYLSEQRRKDTR